MRILIAEDNPTTMRLLESLLAKMGHIVSTVNDGLAAWHMLEHQSSDTPRIAILDWMMPRMQGPDLCRRARATPFPIQPYIILVTSRDSREDLIAGLKSGADDYLAKPFDHAELQARVQNGVRIMELQEALLEKAKQLDEFQAQVELLQSMLPLCPQCKKIKDDKSYWLSVDTYMIKHGSKNWTQGRCGACAAKTAPEA